MQDTVASEMELILILVEGFWPLTNTTKDSVSGAVGLLDTFWLLLFVIYLIKNIQSYLCKVFSEAPLDEHLFM